MEIVFNGIIPRDRPADAHDILDTHRIVSDSRADGHKKAQKSHNNGTFSCLFVPFCGPRYVFNAGNHSVGNPVFAAQSGIPQF